MLQKPEKAFHIPPNVNFPLREFFKRMFKSHHRKMVAFFRPRKQAWGSQKVKKTGD